MLTNALLVFLCCGDDIVHCTMGRYAPDRTEIGNPASAEGVCDERRSFPPLVYRGEDADDWIVEPPSGPVSGQKLRIFTGPNARHRALTYAVEKFGNLRYFPDDDGRR